MRRERHVPADAGARRRMLLLAPHFRRAVNIGKIIDLKRVEAAALADTLDGLAAGMFLVDSGGSIVHANAAGNAALAEETVAQRAAGKLALVDADAQPTMRALCIAAGDGDAAIGSRGIAVPLNARDGERWVAHVLPLTSGTRRKAGQ